MVASPPLPQWHFYRPLRIQPVVILLLSSPPPSSPWSGLVWCGETEPDWPWPALWPPLMQNGLRWWWRDQPSQTPARQPGSSHHQHGVGRGGEGRGSYYGFTDRFSDVDLSNCIWFPMQSDLYIVHSTVLTTDYLKLLSTTEVQILQNTELSAQQGVRWWWWWWWTKTKDIHSFCHSFIKLRT